MRPLRPARLACSKTLFLNLWWMGNLRLETTSGHSSTYATVSGLSGYSKRSNCRKFWTRGHHLDCLRNQVSIFRLRQIQEKTFQADVLMLTAICEEQRRRHNSGRFGLWRELLGYFDSCSNCLQVLRTPLLVLIHRQRDQGRASQVSFDAHSVRPSFY